MTDDPPIFSELICGLGLRARSAEQAAQQRARRLVDVAALHRTSDDGCCTVCAVPAPCPTLQLIEGAVPPADTRPPYDDSGEQQPQALPSAAELFGGSTRGVDRFFDALRLGPPNRG